MANIEFLTSNFLKKDFHENYNKLQNQVKKIFENTLEANNAINIGDLSCYSSDYEDEEIFTDANNLKIWVNNEEIEVPGSIVNVEDYKDILNQQVFNSFDEQEKEHLLSFLPKSDNSQKILEDLFSGKALYHTNPIELFFEKIKSGVYTKTFQKEKEIEGKLTNIYSRNYYENTTNLLNMRIEKQLQHEDGFMIQNLIKRNAVIDLESISADSDISIDSINDIKIEDNLEEISDCETVIETAHEELRMEMGADVEDEMIDTRRVELQKPVATEIYKATKKPEVEPIQPSMSAPKQSKVAKNVVTIKLNPIEWVEEFREQERTRYNNPTRPWTYLLPGGGTGIVAPVIKKITAGNSKPREHFMLKTERPAYVTILCLVRDAAARLPNGEGTRADICELLKESQYIVETIPDEKLSTVVSGALDRLHYEDDPCVKYDSDKKMWIYLHRDRTEDYDPWLDPSDAKNSKKKEYNMKYKNKKKLKTEEHGTTKNDGEANDG